jgi:hypothetical protein
MVRVNFKRGLAQFFKNPAKHKNNAVNLKIKQSNDQATTFFFSCCMLFSILWGN